MFDAVWTNLHAATMADDALGIIEDAAIAVNGDTIAWVGPRAALPGPGAVTHDMGGAWVLPGLVDCHTHLVFGSDRAAEYEMRLAGATYEELSRAGGGILSTVRATRAADEATLLEAALPRLDGLLAEGVTTVEIKSGYGLDSANEAKQLRVARELGRRRAVTIVTSLLAAHAVPPEYAGRRADYARHVAETIIPEVAAEGLADAVDAFADSIGFTNEETGWVFAAAARAGLPVKLHADQLTDQDGAAFSAAHGALSADHLERSNAAGLAEMARAGTVAVLLPGATFTLRETAHPDVPAMRAAGVRMAVSTDMNPGSSPARSLLLMTNMACALFRMTVAEALLGVTRHAAAALGLHDRGVLAVGRRADMAFYRINRPADLVYWMGTNPCIGRVVGGA
ncbi:imidazolonepropionase [Rhodovarius crocodyli]|uniref:Imidazolonepropionase n=1 Tax=Rhodovarius crocodyli TaxID=1979269 RepID=A0A437MET1_9PROT|nr:imidazolonepropionase [Rhodovarius crocodyli]RVT96147.1 imidazolonepropionase [Rhodovarius crocodyli]